MIIDRIVLNGKAANDEIKNNKINMAGNRPWDNRRNANQFGAACCERDVKPPSLK